MAPYWEMISREGGYYDKKYHYDPYIVKKYINYFDDIVLIDNISFDITVNKYDYYAYNVSSLSYNSPVSYYTYSSATIKIREITETKTNHIPSNWRLNRNSGSGIIYYQNNYYSFNETTNLYINWIKDDTEYTMQWIPSILEIPVIIMPFKYNDIINVPNIDVIGYTLEGWYRNAFYTGQKYIGGSYFIFKETYLLGISFFAKWTKNSYTVIWIANGGTLLGTIPDKGIFDENLTPPNIIKSGYTFNNWYTNDTFTGNNYPALIAFNFNYPYTVYFYAKWIPNTYNLDWVLNSGTLLTSAVSSIEYNSILTFPNASRTDFTLDGWYSSSNFNSTRYFESTEINFLFLNDTTFYAKWIGEIFSITWETNNGILADNAPISVMYLDDLTFPYITRTGYTFSGWYANSLYSGTSNAIDSVFNYNLKTDSTYYAKFIVNNYSITWNTNSGTLSATAPSTINYGESIYMPNVSKSDNIFNGWYSNAGFTGHKFEINEYFTYNITTNITFYVKWTDEPTAISWDLNGGTLRTGTLATSYTLNSEFTFPALNDKRGYVFYYWTSNGDYSGTKYYGNTGYLFEWNTSVVFYAFYYPQVAKIIWTFEDSIFQETNIWTGTFEDYIINENPYNFFYNESVTSYSRYYKYDKVIVTPKVIKSGYTLSGWMPTGYDFIRWESLDGTQNDITGIIYKGAFISKFDFGVGFDLIMEPVWTPIKYLVYWNYNIDKNIRSLEVYYEENEYVSLEYEKEKPGYSFLYWAYIKPGVYPQEIIIHSTDFIFNYTNNNIVIFTAFWQINQYTITWDAFVGENESPYYKQITSNFKTRITAPRPIFKDAIIKGWTERLNNLPIIYAPNSNFTVPPYDITYYGYFDYYTIVYWSYNFNMLTPGTSSFINEINLYTSNKILEQVQIVPPLIQPSRGGYIFNGWSSNITSTTSIQYFPVADRYKQSIYYALWIPKNIVINWNALSFGLSSNIVLPTESITTAPNIKLLGYNFNGWYNAQTNGSLVVSGGCNYTITSNSTTLYANFTKTNTIKFSDIQSTFGGINPISISEYQTNISKTANTETNFSIDFIGKGIIY